MSTIPASSDVFSYELAKAVTFVDYHPRSFIRQVDALQRLAERSGLVEKWGQDRIQKCLSDAFKPLRRRR
jgi:hypothetical protein